MSKSAAGSGISFIPTRQAIRYWVSSHVKTEIDVSLSETLNCLRWVAAALVLIYHLRVNIFVEQKITPSIYDSFFGKIFIALTSLGPEAVYLFFVLSGFLVGGGAFADISLGRFSLKRYAAHRCVRIYVVLVPALVIGYMFDVLRVACYGIDYNAGHETAASYAASTFAANLLSLQTVFAPTLGSNIPLWSLANEVWYYAIFGLVISFIVNSDKVPSLLSALAAILIVIVLFIYNKNMIFMMGYWLVGVGARLAPAPLIKSKFASWFVACFILLAYSLIHKASYALANILLAVSFANVVVRSMYDKDSISGPRSRINAWLASFSFSLYVVHAPFLHWLLTQLRGSADPRFSYEAFDIRSVSLFCLCLFMTLLYAYLFSRLTEENTATLRQFADRRLGKPRQPLEACETSARSSTTALR